MTRTRGGNLYSIYILLQYYIIITYNTTVVVYYCIILQFIIIRKYYLYLDTYPVETCADILQTEDIITSFQIVIVETIKYRHCC